MNTPGRRVMTAGAGIALVASGAILSAPAARTANVHIAGLVLILAGILGLLISPRVGDGPSQDEDT